ncbi:hypothetical protein AMECASPLE_038989, partial [Ameca splendens]
EAASTSTPECLPSVAENLNLGFILLNTVFLAISCFLHFLDQGISVPCPPSNIPNPSTPGDLTAPTYWRFVRSRS